MTSNNLNLNNLNEKSKTTKEEENPDIKNNIDGIGDAPTNEATRDAIPPKTNIMKMTDSGDIGSTLYLSSIESDADNTLVEPSGDAESTLDSTTIGSTLGGSITNSSLDETLAETSFEVSIGNLSLNSISGIESLDSTLPGTTEEIIDQVENSTITESLNKNTYLDDEPINNDKLISIENNAAAYASNVLDISQGPANPVVDITESSSKEMEMSTEYEVNESLSMSDSANTSLLVIGDSSLEVSCDQEDTNDQKDLEEIDLVDEKEKSREIYNKILENIADEFGPDVGVRTSCFVFLNLLIYNSFQTTALLFMVRESLEMHLKIEKLYMEPEKRARYIAKRRFHLTLEEFLETINRGIGKKEGLDRYAWFLEEVEKAALKRERCETFKKNLIEFNTFPAYCNKVRPFKFEHEKQAYFKKTPLTAFYMYSAKANNILSKRRGYDSV